MAHVSTAGNRKNGSYGSAPVTTQPTDGFSNSDVSSDEWYLNYISRYKGTDMYQQLLNNPYLRSNASAFSPDLWQQFLESVGDSSARDRYYGDLLSKRNEYLSRIEDEIRQYKQNSPANQAALMAAAGQNPDLLGTGSVANAPENDNLAEPFLPSQSSGAGLPSFEGLANFGVSMISTLIGFANSLQGLEAGSTAIAGAEIDNYTKGMDFASGLLVNSIPADEIDTDKLLHDPSYTDELFIKAAKKIDTSIFSRRTRKTIGYFLNQLEKDPNSGRETYFYKNARAALLNQYTNLTTDSAQKRSHKYYSDNLDDMVQNLGQDFTWYLDEYQQLYNKYLKKRANNDLAVENTPGISRSRASLEKSGASAAYYGAQSAKANYEVNIPQWEIDKLNNKFMRNVSHKLGNYGVVGGIARLMLPSLRSTLEALPSTFGTGVSAIMPGKIGTAARAMSGLYK